MTIRSRLSSSPNGSSRFPFLVGEFALVDRLELRIEPLSNQCLSEVWPERQRGVEVDKSTRFRKVLPLSSSAKLLNTEAATQKQRFTTENAGTKSVEDTLVKRSCCVAKRSYRKHRDKFTCFC